MAVGFGAYMINYKITGSARELIGDLLKKQREELGFSRNEVASHCGLNGAQVKNAEEGTSAYTIDTLLRIAYGMNCQIFITLQPKTTDRDVHDMDALKRG